MNCKDCTYYKTLVGITNKIADVLEENDLIDITSPSMGLMEAKDIANRYTINIYPEKFMVCIPTILSNRIIKYDPDGDIKVIFHSLIEAIRFIRL